MLIVRGKFDTHSFSIYLYLFDSDLTRNLSGDVDECLSKLGSGLGVGIKFFPLPPIPSLPIPPIHTYSLYFIYFLHG